METLSVRCNHCGAPLNVGPETRFVTCQFCASQLEVKRTENSVFTEEIARLARTTGQLAESLEIIELQNEIERLDREWSTRQEAAAGNGERGAAPKSTAGAVFGLLFAVFFAVVCFGMAAAAGSHGAPGIFALVPVGMGVFALVAAVAGIAKAQATSSSRDDYQQQRAALLKQLEELRRR